MAPYSKQQWMHTLFWRDKPVTAFCLAPGLAWILITMFPTLSAETAQLAADWDFWTTPWKKQNVAIRHTPCLHNPLIYLLTVHVWTVPVAQKIPYWTVEWLRNNEWKRHGICSVMVGWVKWPSIKLWLLELDAIIRKARLYYAERAPFPYHLP
jgi:hypothetical protein